MLKLMNYNKISERGKIMFLLGGKTNVIQSRVKALT